MPRYPGAKWRPVTGHTDGPMAAHTGIALHVNQSTGNLFNWVRGDNGMSCHFEVYKNGLIEQFLDTNVTSWCQEDGNSTYLSVETEGYASEPLTAAQVTTLSRLLSWCHTVHGIPLQLAEHPGERGFGWHGMGGDAWGGHPDCPGVLRRSQRATILALARNPTPTRHSVSVKPGDTLTGIAASHRISLAKLVRLNPQIKDVDAISVDQKVYVS